jgi:hypothetical protein
MNHTNEPNPGDNPGAPPPHAYSMDFQHAPVGARVPEKVGRGVFATGLVVLQSGDEFVLDFMSGMVQPHQLAARIVLTAGTFAKLLAAVRIDIGKYEQHIRPLIPPTPPRTQPAEGAVASPAAPGEPTAAGQPPQAPGAPAEGRPAIGDIYDQLKLPDELLGGAFANVIMIHHTPEEFCFDFIASFYPRPVVTCRVYLAAGRILSILDTMSTSYQRYQQTGGGPRPA